jgi:hypothetical protein
MNRQHYPRTHGRRLIATALGLLLLLPALAEAGAREQARRLHDRIAGVPPSQTVLNAMQAQIEAGNPRAAADIAMQNKSFYNVTLKNMVTPWTNEAQTRYAPLNDYTATVVGIVRDDLDFRRVLHDDILYVGVAPSGDALPAYSNDNNNHYAELERRNLNLGDDDILQRRDQSDVTGLPAEATAGVLTSRAASHAFFIAGTNRAMLRFTLMNHLCRDLEQVKDNTRPPDRIRQDVSRSPGGDSRVFHGTCLACHAGMDPLAQAFAYYDFDGIEGEAGGRLSWNREGDIDPFTGIRVKKKYWINSNNFVHGFITPDDSWENYWRRGVNEHLGWDASLPGKGNGAKSLGQELAHSTAFAQCQVKKVFRTVCLRDPSTAADHNAVNAITGTFRNNGYSLRRVFAETGSYCMGN